MLSIRFGLGLG